MREYEYDVALSFAGEDRQHAEALAELLANNGYEVFYDKYERSQLWGKNLYTHLSSVYKDKARYCVTFLSEYYARKLWANHERESAQTRAFEENKEYILPVRLDDTEIPGIFRTVGYLDLRSVSINEVYQALVEKLPNPPSQRAALPATSSVVENETTTTTLSGWPKDEQEFASAIIDIVKRRHEKYEREYREGKEQKPVLLEHIKFGPKDFENYPHIMQGIKPYHKPELTVREMLSSFCQRGEIKVYVDKIYMLSKDGFLYKRLTEKLASTP